MKIALLTIGSRGDVQPYAALALGLRDAGHEVRFATLKRHRWLIEPLGLTYVPLDHEPFLLMAHRPRNPKAYIFEAFDSWYAAARGADLLVAHPLIFAAPDIAEKLGIPLVVASTLPAVCPTAAFPNVYLFGRSLGPALNRASYRLMPAALSPFEVLRRLWRRRALGLSTRPTPLTGSVRNPVTHVHGYSPHVLPRPPDWLRHYEVCGYWRTGVAQPQGLPADLEAFLDAGEPPLYIGFGSMKHSRSAVLTRMVLEAIDGLGLRAVIARGSGALSMEVVKKQGNPRLFALESPQGVSHDALFARVSHVIHHGGPGTLGSALYAGKPQVICPFAMDQPFWAARAARLGVAPEPLPIRSLTAVSLSRRIRETLHGKHYEEHAAQLRAALEREDGVAAAVATIERVAKGSQAAPFEPERA